jgi:hypothetical protein
MPSESLGPLFMARKLPPGSPDTLLPPSTKEFFLASSVEGTYKDKKILSLHGALDMIMPHAWGQADWDRIAAECPAAAMHVQPDAGHIVSTEMVRMTAEWLWYYGLTEA